MHFIGPFLDTGNHSYGNAYKYLSLFESGFRLPMQLPGTLCNTCSATSQNRDSVKSFAVLLIWVLTRCLRGLHL